MVSVIVPNFNHAPYLKRRIDSILNQTYQNFELILLDDCSTDNSAEILLEYKNNPKVSNILINEKNSGSPFLQWNKGFELAKGEYIWIAESDDWCEPTLLETIVEPLLNNSQNVLSFCQSLVVNLENEIVYKTQFPLLVDTMIGKEFLSNFMFGDCSIINSGMAVFRKSALKNVDNKYLGFKSAGDWMFWSQICAQGNVFISGKYLNYFTRHSKTVSSNAEKTGVDFIEGCEVFNWIRNMVKPSTEILNMAINTRLNLYFNQSKNYIDKQVAINSLFSLLNIDSSVKWLFVRKLFFKKSISQLIVHLKLFSILQLNKHFYVKKN